MKLDKKSIKAGTAFYEVMFIMAFATTTAGIITAEINPEIPGLREQLTAILILLFLLQVVVAVLYFITKGGR